MTKLIEESAKSCDFCNFAKSTAEDVFGRIESVHAVTAANAFKYDGFHSLVLFRKHSTIDWNEEQFLDLMGTAGKWSVVLRGEIPCRMALQGETNQPPHHLLYLPLITGLARRTSATATSSTHT